MRIKRAWCIVSILMDVLCEFILSLYFVDHVNISWSLPKNFLSRLSPPSVCFSSGYTPSTQSPLSRLSSRFQTQLLRPDRPPRCLDHLVSARSLRATQVEYISERVFIIVNADRKRSGSGHTILLTDVAPPVAGVLVITMAIDVALTAAASCRES